MTRFDALSPDELARLARAGDEAAFAALHERLRPRLRAYAMRIVPAEDADDVLQDVFVGLHATLLEDEREIQVVAWLHRLVRNRCIDVLRSRQGGLAAEPDTPALAGAPATSGADPEAAALGAEELRSVTGAIRGLPDRQRSAFVLAVFEGRSHHQIATRLGTSVAGSKALVLRARLALARDAARRGVLALAGPFAKLGNVAGEHTPVAWVAVAAVAASPALLVGGGRIVSEQVLRPGDPSPRSSHVGAPKGSPLPPGRTYVEAKVALDAGAQPAGRRYLRLTCPPGLVFAGGMSAGGGSAAPALRSSGLSRWQHRAGRYRSAQIQFLTRRRLARDYVATFGITCMTREGYRAKRRRDRRFMCGVRRQLIREHWQRGEPVPRPIGEAMAGDCGG